jgi:hypothetical protein
VLIESLYDCHYGASSSSTVNYLRASCAPELRRSHYAGTAAPAHAIFARTLREPVPGGVVAEAGLRSGVEDRWRAAYQHADSGDLAALRRADPDLVREDSAVLGAALRRVLERLPEGGRGLAVGHSPTNEAAVLGLTGSIIEPMAKGAGVLVVADGDEAHVQALG